MLCNGAPVLAQEQVGVDPVNVGGSAELTDGLPTGVVQLKIPPEAFGNWPIDGTKPAPDKLPTRPVSKIHPDLSALITSRPASDLVDVVVVFEENTRIPPMPLLDSTLPREAPENAARLKEIEAKITAIKAVRGATHAANASMLAREFGGRTKDSFWLINGVVVELPLSAMRGLAQRPDVLSIEPQQTTSPPANHGTANHVSNARARIGTDPYFNMVQLGGYIGLLDTGIRSTHSLLAAPDGIAFERDCTGGDTNGVCNALPNPQDDFWNHGVSTAAILTGNNNMSNTYRGVTAFTVDSFKVFTSAGHDTAAVVTGFQNAVFVGDRVILTPVQSSTDHGGAISLAADAAFDANHIVVNAAGNFGPNSGTVRAPGNAHKVLAIGSYDVVTTTLNSTSGRGPTTDGRIKPDVTCPSSTLTASRTSDTATQVFGGTSGATPYCAGAAMLYGNWFAHSSVYDAGYVYAFMILNGGNLSTSNAYDNNLGAGRLSSAANGNVNWWKIIVSNGQSVNLTFPISTTRTEIRAAMWWPETSAQAHNDIDLSVINPAGSQVASSNGRLNVFEKANVTQSTALPQGTWTVRARGFEVLTSAPQTVYVMVHQR